MKRNSKHRSVGLVALFGLTAAIVVAGPANAAGAADSTRLLPAISACGHDANLYFRGLSEKRLNEVCAEIDYARSVFTPIFGTSPANGDYTEGIEVHVAQTPREYEQLSALLDFDGEDRSVYIENDASVRGNRGDVLLNLVKSRPVANASTAHEYIHYLDGHINLAGNGDTDVPLTWWAEGLAQALTNSEPRDAAREVIDYDFILSEIMNVNAVAEDDAGEVMIYSGGEMAVRFFMLNHPDRLREMLSHTRSGAYDRYTQWHGRIGRTLDSEFAVFVRQQAQQQAQRAAVLPSIDLTSADPLWQAAVNVALEKPTVAANAHATGSGTSKRIVKKKIVVKVAKKKVAKKILVKIAKKKANRKV